MMFSTANRLSFSFFLGKGRGAALGICFVLVFFSAAFAEEPGLFQKKIGDAFSQAEYHFHSGDLLEAKRLYQEFLENAAGDGPRMERALFRLGEIDQTNKSDATALGFFKILLSKNPGTSLADETRFRMAVSFFRIEMVEEAEALFRETLNSSPDKNMRIESLYHLGRIAEARFDYEDSIGKLKQTYMQSGKKEIRDHAVLLIDQMINEKLSRIQLVNLSQKLRSGFPVDRILLKLIGFYRMERDIPGYQGALENFIRMFPDHAMRPKMERFMAIVKGGSSHLARLGVILPLTGNKAIIGQKVLQGIQLAVNQSGLGLENKLELVIKNSDSTPNIAELAEDLASDPNMLGIIGPMLSEQVPEVAPVAGAYQIPMFSPTASSSGIPELSPYIFRNALTREMQGQFMARYAMNGLGLRRFVVIYPLEAYGMDLKDSFVQEVESLGGQVVAMDSYERGQSDFRDQILKIGGVPDDDLQKIVDDQLVKNIKPPELGTDGVLSRPRIEMGHLTEEKVENMKVSLELGYDAIYLPGYFDKVGLIIPQLVFYNVDKVPLLGASGWNSPELFRLAGKHLKAGYFVDGFFADSQEPHVKLFVQKYKNTFGELPNIFAAQSYDTAKMFIEIVLSGVSNRVAARDRLLTIHDFAGVSGTTTILKNGESDKRLFTLKVEQKNFVEMH